MDTSTIAVPFPKAIPQHGEFGFNAIRFSGPHVPAPASPAPTANDLETCGAFRARVSELAAGYAAGGGDVTLLEEVKDGMVVQCEISVSHEPQPESLADLRKDHREAGGRPSSTAAGAPARSDPNTLTPAANTRG